MKRDPRLAALALSSSLLLGACAGSAPNQGGVGGGSGGGGKIYDLDGSVERLPFDSSWEYIPPVNPDARPLRCDETGQDCTKCINIKSIGQVAHYGNPPNSDSTDAFKSYLNNTSNARFIISTTKPTITAEWLSNYDVLILQALEIDEYQPNNIWTFSQSEMDALATWVKDGGNGLIAMIGYGGNSTEVNGSNQLLKFAGIQYGTTDTFTSSNDYKVYCNGGSLPFSAWTAGSFIAKNMVVKGTTTPAAVGIFHGRPITCDDNVEGPCEVLGRDPVEGIVAVAKTVGKGHVFVFNDEWVTYTSQWTSAAAIAANASVADPNCDGHRPDEIFNIPQFWQNAIEWTRPSDAACAFVINDPQVIP